MNTELLKAGFILIAVTGFVLFNFANKQNFKKLGKLIFKSKADKNKLFVN